jgi:hypothetical protein
MAVDTITIAGKTFNVPLRYEAGHEINAAEARALNQTFMENLGNNIRRKVKEAIEAGSFDQDAFQAQLEQAAASYEFFGRTGGGGGGGRRDPVMSEAVEIALGKVKDAIKAKGLNLKDYSAKQLRDLAKQVVDRDPAILELAKQRVEENRATASASLDDLLGSIIPAATSDTPATSAAPTEAPAQAA